MEPAPSPPPPVAELEPFELDFRITRREYLHGITSGLPVAGLLFVIGGIIYSIWVMGALSDPSPSAWGRVAPAPVLLVGFEIAYARFREGVHYGFCSDGVHVTWSGEHMLLRWPGLRVRETSRATVFPLLGLFGPPLPDRVVRAPNDERLERWLTARAERGKGGLSWLTKGLIILGSALAFVTVYNLFQSSSPPRRHVADIITISPADNGAVVLTMVLRAQGEPVSLDQIRGQLAEEIEPYSIRALAKVAEAHGVRLASYQVTPPSGLQRASMPCIVLVPTEPGGKEKKFVVVESADANQVVLVDPQVGHLTLSRAELARGWSGIVYVPEPGRIKAPAP